MHTNQKKFDSSLLPRFAANSFFICGNSVIVGADAERLLLNAHFAKNQKNSRLEINMPVMAHPSQKFSKRVLGVRMILELFESSRM